MSKATTNVPNDESAPHRAVLWLQAEVYQMLKTGECSGHSVHSVQRFPIYIDGPDRYVAINQLLEAVEEVKSKCHSKKAGS